MHVTVLFILLEKRKQDSTGFETNISFTF